MLKRHNVMIKRDICSDFRSNFLVSISVLINIGKRKSVPGSVAADIFSLFFGGQPDFTDNSCETFDRTYEYIPAIHTLYYKTAR